MKEVIDRFTGEYRFLSNFSPAEVWHDGIRYPSVEHAFQAAKTLDFAKRWEISKLDSPGAAKRAGRELVLRPDWEDCKYDIMSELVLQKFARHPLARAALLQLSGTKLVEGNSWHDNTWGDCHCPACSHTPGKNALGLILMTVTKLLR